MVKLKESLPRVLLLDFDKKVANKIKEESKFSMFTGRSGYVDGKRLIPRDSSEVEIVFWDISKCDFKYENPVGDPIAVILGAMGEDGRRDTLKSTPKSIIPLGKDTLKVSRKAFPEFLNQVINKGGFIGSFLGEREINGYELTKAVSLQFSCYGGGHNTLRFTFGGRYTRNILRTVATESDLFHEFFRRFVQDEDIKFYIDVTRSNIKPDITYHLYDSDKKTYSVIVHNKFMISPKVNHLDKAVVFLLQDVLPSVCGTNIYPELHIYKWLKDEFFVFPEMLEQQKKLSLIKKKFNEEIAKETQILEKLNHKHVYLSKMLSEDGDSLKNSVKQVLKEDLGFESVRDSDDERIQEGKALKEDILVNNNVFIEVKGTEKGASQGWKEQLKNHVYQYCAYTKADIQTLKQVLIFNHERRRDPRTDRNKPFQNDPEFLAGCAQDNFALIPVFELFKLVKSIKAGKINQADARNLLLDCKGLFEYRGE